MDREIYWVAYFKNGIVEHLVMGPFTDGGGAADAMRIHGEDHHCVVKQVITVELDLTWN